MNNLSSAQTLRRWAAHTISSMDDRRPDVEVAQAALKVLERLDVARNDNSATLLAFQSLIDALKKDEALGEKIVDSILKANPFYLDVYKGGGYKAVIERIFNEIDKRSGCGKERCEKQIANLEKRIANQRGHIEDHLDENKALRKQNKIVSEKLKQDPDILRLERENREKQDEIIVRGDRISDLSNEIRRLQYEKSTLRQQVDAYVTELEKRGERPAGVTAPLLAATRELVNQSSMPGASLSQHYYDKWHRVWKLLNQLPENREHSYISFKLQEFFEDLVKIFDQWFYRATVPDKEVWKDVELRATRLLEQVKGQPYHEWLTKQDKDKHVARIDQQTLLIKALEEKEQKLLERVKRAEEVFYLLGKLSFEDHELEKGVWSEWTDLWNAYRTEYLSG